MEDIAKIYDCAGNFILTIAWLKQARISGGICWGAGMRLEHLDDKLLKLLKQHELDQQAQLWSTAFGPVYIHEDDDISLHNFEIKINVHHHVSAEISQVNTNLASNIIIQNFSHGDITNMGLFSYPFTTSAASATSTESTYINRFFSCINVNWFCPIQSWLSGQDKFI